MPSGCWSGGPRTRLVDPETCWRLRVGFEGHNTSKRLSKEDVWWSQQTRTVPEAVDHRKRFSTPQWSSRGFCNSCPRDSLLVIGDEIIETPMVWPCRYFET